MSSSRLPHEPSEAVRVSRRALFAVREELRRHGADPDPLSDREVVDYALQSWVYQSRHCDTSTQQRPFHKEVVE